jgi:hypothetical protein
VTHECPRRDIEDHLFQLRVEPLSTLIKLKGVTGLYKRHQPAPTARKIALVSTLGKD